MYETENDDSSIKITDFALYPILEKELLKHAIVSSAQYCGI